MCGFVGLVGGPSYFNDFSEVRLEEARKLVAHRGPDSRGHTWRPEEGIALAFARLRILDLSEAADQPMWTEDGRVGLVFNGEIYNFRDLRDALERRGVRFRSTGDSEVLLQSYLAWGDECVGRLTGMWAFAIVDLRRGAPRVLLSRDRMGEKPLFWHWDRSYRRIAFASEMASLVALPGVQREVDLVGLRTYLALGYVPAPRTMLLSVSKLQPGTSLVVDGDAEPVVHRWWEPPVPGAGRAPTVSEVRELVEAAVERRRVSDVPIGVLLSGGVDSSIVAGLLARTGPIRTFSAAFNVGTRSFKYNVDADMAERVARGIGAEHTRLELEMTAGLIDELRTSIRAVGEPHANPTTLTTMLLAREVRNAGVTVVLTGDGSDELFGGYDRYRLERWIRRATRLGRTTRILTHLPERGRTAGLNQMGRRAAMNSCSAERYLGWWSVLASVERDEILTPEACASGEPEHSIGMALAGFESVLDEDAVAALDLAWWIPDESNARLDHATMAAGVEARAVFEDHALVERVAAARMSDKVGKLRWNRKGLLLDAFSDILPREVVDRPKWGWFSPVHYWVNEALWDEFAEVVHWLPETGLFTEDVARFVAKRPTKDPHAVWALAVFGLWYRWMVGGDS